MGEEIQRDLDEIEKILVQAEKEQIKFVKNGIENHIKEKFKIDYERHPLRDKTTDRFTLKYLGHDDNDKISEYLLTLLATAVIRMEKIEEIKENTKGYFAWTPE